MQYALPIDGYASEYNDDIEFFVACYQHSDDPLQSFIRREIEVASSNFETDTAVRYTIEGHDTLFETREDAEQHRDFLCMTYGIQDGWPISIVEFDYTR